MRLQLQLPPLLVTVHGRPALLLARRGDRCFVQVSSGPGANHLRWVPADEVGPSAAGDQQRLRADAERPLQVVQHRGREPRSAR